MLLKANSIQKKVCVAILTSDKTDFKPKKVTRDKKSIQREQFIKKT